MTTILANDMMEGARALALELRARDTQADELRRLPDATVKDLQELGLLAVAVPKELGGLGGDPTHILDVVIELARGSGASAWCGGNWAVHNLLAAMFSPEAQAEVYEAAKPQMPVVSTGFSPLRGTTKAVDGGAVISGQWDFASGVDHAQWVAVMAIGEQGPTAHLVPKSELTIVDTWRTTGLRGTGSQDVAAEELFVPEHRVLPMAAANEGQSPSRDLYPDAAFLRVPMASWFSAGVIGTVLGLTHGMIESFLESTGGKVGGLSGVRVNTKPEIHHKLGESAADVRAATAITRATFAEIGEAGRSQREITMDDRLGWRRDVAWAAKCAVGAVTRLYEVGGAHVLFVGDPIEQRHRDTIAASHHYGLSWDNLFAAYGRQMNGLDHGIAMV